MENFWKSKGLARFNKLPYSPQLQVTEEVSNRTVQNYLP